jgi:biopolymer transport protein ExbB
MRRSIFTVSGFLLLGIVAGVIFPSSAAHAWWNDDWSLRKKLTIDTSSTGASITDPIGTMPVLVRLHAGNFKFDAAKDDGSDLRFVAGDDKTPLKYHIEKFDSLLGEAFVWVNVPDVKPGAQTNIFLYYANKKAVAAEDAKGTYDPDTVLVYHFAESGVPAHDSSTWANNAQNAGLPASASLIGPGLRLDGQTTVTIPASPSLRWADGATMTWSAWINASALQPDAVLYSRRDGANAFKIGVANGVPYAEVTNAAGTQRSAAAAPIAASSWHHLAVAAGQQIALYVDGNAYATLNATLSSMDSPAIIGGDASGPATSPATAGFAGEIDELEIAKAVRPAGFIKAAAIGQGGELAAKFLVFGGDEETATWVSGYLAVILRSVTLDGWVVIGILMVMAVISWMVMVDKAVYVGRVMRANSQFLKTFRHLAADLVILDRGDADEITDTDKRLTKADKRVMQHSALYRIYHIGAEEIRHRFADDGQPQYLSAQSIAAIRASLDTGLVRETQKLNRLMVFLTIAISGGPFLGLLGTVVGVMITFAAIAASGDVNVNAIAPGIAAALVATVAGLAVAIPALFGYNYLTSRIKDATSDMHVFVDEFVTKMAEFYRGQADHRPIAAE